MTGNPYMQWIWAHFASIRSTLIVVTAILTIAALCAAFANNWHAAALMQAMAFLCKWVECWLLEKALVEAQEAM